jgi:phenylacetate-CoA ligase
MNNRAVLSAYTMDDRSIESMLRYMKSYRPDYLFSYPSSLIHLCDYISCNSDFLYLLPKGIITSGEKLDQFQRDRIEAQFQTKVYNFYGCREVGSIAQECLHREGMHVISENVIVEVVDESGQAVIGKEGDILISDLNNRVMPFIRYRIGDRGRILASQCSCGRIGFPLIEVSGRSFDTIRSPQGNAVGGTFWTLLFRSKPGIRSFRVIQEQMDAVHIDYVSEDGNAIPRKTIHFFLKEIHF